MTRSDRKRLSLRSPEGWRFLRRSHAHRGFPSSAPPWVAHVHSSEMFTLLRTLDVLMIDGWEWAAVDALGALGGARAIFGAAYPGAVWRKLA